MIGERQRAYRGIPAAQKDKIVYLGNAARADARPGVLNLVLGEIYHEDAQTLWVPDVFYKARKLSEAKSNEYLLPHGLMSWIGVDGYITGSVKGIFGDEAEELLTENRIAAVTTDGGTHAIMVFARTLAIEAKTIGKDPTTVIMSSPGYGNHKAIFESCGIPVKTYNHLNNGHYDHQSLLEAIDTAQPYSVLLLQGDAHNPTGHNFKTVEEIDQIAAAVLAHEMTVFVDLPYQGLYEGHVEDAWFIRRLREKGVCVTTALSGSKNIGGYNLRLGIDVYAANDFAEASDVTGMYNDVMRRTTSSPPAPGQYIMDEIYNNTEYHNEQGQTLREEWFDQLAKVRQFLHRRRELFAQALPQPYAAQVAAGHVMYAQVPIHAEAAEYLVKEKALYVLPPLVPGYSWSRVNFGRLPIARAEEAGAKVREAIERFPPLAA